MFKPSRKTVLSAAAVVIFLAVAFVVPDASAAFEFHNVIKSEGQCGANNAGHDDKLVNTDTSKKSKVLLNIEWNDAGETGSYQKSLVNEAGATLDLGCSLDGKAKYVRTIVSETKP